VNRFTVLSRCQLSFNFGLFLFPSCSVPPPRYRMRPCPFGFPRRRTTTVLFRTMSTASFKHSHQALACFRVLTLEDEHRRSLFERLRGSPLKSKSVGSFRRLMVPFLRWVVFVSWQPPLVWLTWQPIFRPGFPLGPPLDHHFSFL